MSSTPDVLEALADSFDFLRGVEANQSTAAYTLDHAIQDQLNLLQQGVTTALTDPQGNNVGSRLSLYDQLSQLQQNIDSITQTLTAAGNDPAKLEALNMSQVGEDNPTTDSDSPDSSVSSGGG